MSENKSHWLSLSALQDRAGGSDEDVERAREALGRLGQAPSGQRANGQFFPRRPRRPFVQDGEVAVEIRPTVEGGANLRAAAQTEALVERAARRAAEEALAEAQRTIEDLRTRLAHKELALQEACTAAERAVAEARAGRPARAVQRPPQAAVAPVQKKPIGRPRKHPMPSTARSQGEAVRWWEPGWKKGFGIR